MKIFSLLSNKITDFLYKKEVISQEQKEVYIYGFTVLFLNILDILIILTLGILIECLFRLYENVKCKFCQFCIPILQTS